MTTEHAEGFSTNELQLPYAEWKALAEVRGKHPQLHPEVRKWLHAWRLHDLMSSPMDDDQRRVMRYGHYLGWLDRHYAKC
jgi:hypothetical protein